MGVMEEMCEKERKRERESMAQSLLAIGKLTLEEIAECARLSLDEVKRLRAAMPQ